MLCMLCYVIVFMLCDCEFEIKHQNILFKIDAKSYKKNIPHINCHKSL